MFEQPEPADHEPGLKAGEVDEDRVESLRGHVLGDSHMRVVRVPPRTIDRGAGVDRIGAPLALADARSDRDKYHLGHRAERTGPAQVQRERRIRASHRKKVGVNLPHPGGVHLRGPEQCHMGWHVLRLRVTRRGPPAGESLPPRRRNIDSNTYSGTTTRDGKPTGHDRHSVRPSRQEPNS